MVNLINHASALGSNDATATSNKSANVRLQWSSESSRYFDKDPSELQHSSTQLLLELVTLCDIVQGEEILLDYGDEWTQAWQKHVEAWVEPEIDDFVVTSHVLNT